MKKYKSVVMITIGTILIVVVFVIALVLAKNKIDSRDSRDVDANSKVETNETAKAKLVKKGMSTAFSAASGKDIDVNEYIEDNFAEEDARFVNEMLDDKVDGDVVMQIVKSYISDGDISGETLKSLTDKLTPDEKDRLENIYDMYGDDFLEYIKGR